jgi:hypothetical protein
MNEYGIIGKSGKFYPCDHHGHLETSVCHEEDSPFVCCYPDGVTFDAYYTSEKTLPTKKQVEAVMDWCAANEISFEYATECWSDPWNKWK